MAHQSTLRDLKEGDCFRFLGEAVRYELVMEIDEIGCVGYEKIKGWDGCYFETPASTVVIKVAKHRGYGCR